MTVVDRKFAVLHPTLDRLCRPALKIDNTALLNPNSTSPLALVDGELCQLTATGTVTRATDEAKPSWFCIDDRGDTGVQAARKLTLIMAGGAFIANTVLFNSGLTTVGAKVMFGSVTIDVAGRAGLIAHTGSNVVVGYVLKVAAANGGLLQIVSALT